MKNIISRHFFVAVILPFFTILGSFLINKNLTNKIVINLGYNESNQLAQLIKNVLSDDSVQLSDEAIFNNIKNLSTRVTCIWLDEKKTIDNFSSVPDEKNSDYQLLVNSYEVQQAILTGQGINIYTANSLKNIAVATTLRFYNEQRGLGVVRVGVALTNLKNDSYAWLIALPSILLTVAVMIIIIFWTHQIRQMVNYVEKTTIAYTQGNFDYIEVPPVQNPEVRHIVDNLDQLRLSLKKKIDEIESRSDEFDSLFEALGDPIFLLDGYDNIRRYNLQASQLLNIRHYPKERRFTRLFIYQDVAEKLLQASKLAKTSETFHLGLRSYKVVGRKLITGHFLVMLAEITDLVKSEKLRREFVSNVSHELRTPVANIKGYVETIQTINLTKEDHDRFMEIINTEANRLSSIIEGLLRLSRLEEDQNALLKERFPVCDLLESIATTVSGKVAAKNMSIKVLCAEEMSLEADISLAEDAIISLIENAIRYCPEGTLIQLRVDHDEEWMNIYVDDSGPGIDIDDESRLFERFYRGGDEGRGRASGGVGLGLAIVKQIMIAHGGHIHLQKKKSSGSCFVLSFPLH